MKMSKSINDYKEAMDNIKISESFYKRTEMLLTEIPEVKIEKRPLINGRRISAVIMSAAACVICLFGVKLAVDGRSTDIVTETSADASLDGGAGEATETGRGADELIDDFGDYEDDGIIAESIEHNIDGGQETSVQKPVAVKPATSPDTDSTPTETAPPKTTAEIKTTTTTAATEKRVVQGIDPFASTNSPEPADAGEVETPDLEMPNPGVSGGYDDVEYDEDVIDNDEAPAVDEPSAAAPTAASGGESSLFGELSLDNVTVDVTPYFSMNDIVSGEGTLNKSGTEFKPVLDLIANMDSSATKIGNGSFTSLFSIRIYDRNIDLDFYSIYLTNHESIVITKHSPDGSQLRETYALRREYYEELRKQLFLLFCAEGDYELFLNLIGGK